MSRLVLELETGRFFARPRVNHHPERGQRVDRGFAYGLT